jgi:hypothetical protein
MSSSQAAAFHRNIGVLARQSPENRSNSTRCYPLCSFHASQRRNSSVSTAMTMSLAHNLLQKQQKQREQGLCGNPVCILATWKWTAVSTGDWSQVMRFSKVAAHQGHGDGIASGQVLQLTDEMAL